MSGLQKLSWSFWQSQELAGSMNRKAEEDY
jgi:hypothetical protein